MAWHTATSAEGVCFIVALAKGRGTLRCCTLLALQKGCGALRMAYSLWLKLKKVSLCISVTRCFEVLPFSIVMLSMLSTVVQLRAYR